MVKRTHHRVEAADDISVKGALHRSAPLRVNVTVISAQEHIAAASPITETRHYIVVCQRRSVASTCREPCAQFRRACIRQYDVPLSIRMGAHSDQCTEARYLSSPVTGVGVGHSVTSSAGVKVMSHRHLGSSRDRYCSAHARTSSTLSHVALLPFTQHHGHLRAPLAKVALTGACHVGKSIQQVISLCQIAKF